MADEFRVVGAGDMQAAATALRRGSKDVKRALYKALNGSTNDLKDAARGGALLYLPQSGGLGLEVSSATIRAKLTGEKKPRLYLEATKTAASVARFKKAHARDVRRARKAQRVYAKTHQRRLALKKERQARDSGFWNGE